MIRTSKLRKAYASFEALKGIDLHVQAGDIYGFIGPNGAGKTTTIRILTTLLEPTSGEAWIDGHSCWEAKEKVRASIGYLPDNFGVYRDMTVTEYLHFFAAAYAIKPASRPSLVKGLLELVDLDTKADSLIEGLSRGMQQRLGLARTLVHDPKVLILDEPASGLDPRARIEIREILKELQRMGKTILLSSHILPELQEVCSRIGILERGVLVAQGTVPEIMASARDDVEILLSSTDDARAATLLRELPEVARAERDEERDLVSVRLASELDLAKVSEHLSGRGVHLRRLERHAPTLEQVFMKLTKGLVA